MKKLFGARGDGGLGVFFGRQRVTVGDGFLIYGGGTNFGNGLAEASITVVAVPAWERARTKKAVLRLGGQEDWRRET